MTRIRLLAAVTAFAAAAVALVSEPAALTARPAAEWVTVKGTVVWPAAKPLPERAKLTVTADKEHCTSKGDILDETVLVNKSNKGVKNVWVYLRPTGAESFAAGDINPALAGKAAEHVIDQPCCMFIPRIFAARAGDVLVVKNSSPVPHNINFNSDDLSFNQTVPAGGQFKADKPLAAQKGPATFACNIHPWMTGKAMVFDHPYFAVTDEDGKFEIKLAPGGTQRITYRHENGYHKGRDGAKGFPVELKGGTVELPPLELMLP